MTLGWSLIKYHIGLLHHSVSWLNDVKHDTETTELTLLQVSDLQQLTEVLFMCSGYDWVELNSVTRNMKSGPGWDGTKNTQCHNNTAASNTGGLRFIWQRFLIHDK